MPSEYWLVTVEKRFTKSRSLQRTFVTKLHPLDVLKAEGPPADDYEASIVFAMPIDEATYEKHDDIQNNYG